MDTSQQLLVALVGAVISAFLYPIVAWILRFLRARDALKKIFKSSETIRLVPSYVETGTSGRPSVRSADFRVTSAISALCVTENADDTIPFSFKLPAFPLVVTGSIRYNKIAQDFQEKYHLPFEFVTARHADSPADRLLTILTQFGEELVSSADATFFEEGMEVDYGIILIARLLDGRLFYWFAGIHSAGTEGAWAYLERESASIFRKLPTRKGRYISLLIRVRYPFRMNSSAHQPPQGVESLGPAVTGTLRRRESDEAPLAMLCDLGNVLMDFDRSRTYRAIAHYTNRSWREVEAVFEGSDIRELYECGAIDTDAFCAKVYDILDIDQSVIQRPLLEEFWGDIFWLNREMFEALKHLKSHGMHLVLLSNTNPLHFDTVARDYPDMLALFSAKVLSYEVGAAKPGNSIFEKAIEVVHELSPDCPTSRMLMIDDMRENVTSARKFGMRALQYRSYSHFVFWIRSQSLYVP